MLITKGELKVANIAIEDYINPAILCSAIEFPSSQVVRIELNECYWSEYLRQQLKDAGWSCQVGSQFTKEIGGLGGDSTANYLEILLT